ncbi:Retrovirus-related Pol polyprotein from transposon TNT 1-94 [Anthophora plagiata]
MESMSLKIEKLRDSDNWLQWRFVIRTLLEEDDDTLNVCEGKLERPAENSANYQVNLQKFLKADKTARRLIVTSVEKKPLDLLLSCTTAREMWKKLNAVYDMKSDENLSIVQKQFFDFKWDSGESVSHNLAKIEQLTTKMKSLGGAVPDSIILTRILSILPKKFNHFHSAWDSVEDKKKTLENLTARLMTEEVRTLEQDSSEDMAVALLMKRRSSNTSFSKNNYHHRPNQDERRKNFSGCYTCGKTDHIRKDCVGCHVCGSKGHLSRNCFKRNGNFRTRNSGGVQQTSTSAHKQAFVGSSSEFNNEDVWLVDSGATDHMTHRRDFFSDFEKFEEPITIRLGNGDLTPAYGKGNVEIETYVNGKWIPGIMYDVLFVPKLSQNLFSIITVIRKGIDHAITEYGEKCVFSRDGAVIATGSIWGDLFKVNLRVVTPKKCNLAGNVSSEKECIKSCNESLQLWHERLCHQNYKHVKYFLKNKGIHVIDDNVFCEGCAYGKHHRLSFHNRSDRATKCREIIHADVCGPMEHESIGKK